MWTAVAKADALAPGELLRVNVKRRDVVVCRTPAGDLRALFSVCPHRGGNLGYGRLCPLVTSKRFGDYELEVTRTVLRCPWHAYEFDTGTGVAVADPSFRVQTYPVREQDGEILVDV